MNILIIPSWYPNTQDDIVGSFFREQSIALAKRGHSVYVLNGTYTRYQNFFSELCMKVCIQEDNGIHVVRQLIPSFGFSRFPTLYIKLFEARIRKLLKKLLQQYPNIKFEVIHAHSFYPAGIAATRLGRNQSIPVIVTEHRSTLLSSAIPNKLKSYLIETIQGCEKFICVGVGLKKRIENISGISEKTTVIPNIVSDIFAPPQNNKFNENFVFVSIGGLVTRKRHSQLVRCFNSAFAGNLNVKLIIVGEGEERTKIEQMIRKYHIEDQVTLTGKLPREKVVEVLQNSDAFILTSAYETFGVVYVEALACGKPIIGARNGGAEDIINDENGIIVDVDNDEQLINAMRQMYLERSKYDTERISLQTRDKYSEDSIITQLVDIYHWAIDTYGVTSKF